MAQTPISNMQASLGLTQYFPVTGLFPSQGGGGTSFYLGEIGTFAGNFVPAGVSASGQLLSIVQNTAVFSLVGTYYGGNGQTTFALPNLNGTTMVGTGQGPGLDPETIGEQTGSSTVTLSYGQTPANDLNPFGQNQSFDNRQPSLGITYEIATQGVYPPNGGGSTPLNSIGMVMAFAGNFEVGGYMACDGRLLSIAQYDVLFSLLGTTYGGDGQTTFALPDLRGRDIIGASAATPIGTKVGQESVTLTNGQTPSGLGGPVAPFDNRQPSLAMEYVIALQGIFPSPGGNQDATTPFLGQVVSFAGTYVPGGWALCDGSLLSINQNQALFALLGTTYGGNGITTFALPDLRDKAVIGTGAGITLGMKIGANNVTVTADELPFPMPRYGGAAVTVGEFGAWTPVDSVQNGAGYQIVWKNGAADQFLVWNVDGAGNWLSQGTVLAGTSYALQSLEPTFGQDLNGDGTTGLAVTTIEAFGSTDLKQVADTFFLYAHGTSTGPQLKMSGAAVTVGQFGAWTPIGAAQSGGGYQIVWKNGGADQYIVWNVDSAGNWLSWGPVLAGSAYGVQSLESTFGQNLNGDGTLGPIVTTLEAAGSTDLKQVADTFFLYAHGTNTGPQLKMSNAAVTVGQFGSWTPLGAEKTANGTYLVVWKNGGADQYTVWNVDSAGNWLSQSDPMAGASSGIQALEPGFNQDLNGGGIATRNVIESAGSTALASIANSFVVSPTSSALGVQLKMSGAAVTSGQFGSWTPIGAEQAANGTYQVVWKNGGADQYIVWNVDAAGNWLSQTDPMPGASSALQVLEPGFNQDLNGVGGISARTVIESAGSTTLAKIANSFVVSPTSSAIGLQLKMSGAAVTVGQFGSWTPIGAEQAANGTYQVAWKNGALDQYLSWTVDSAGNYLSQSMTVAGGTWHVENYETTLQQDLNGDGTTGPVTTSIETIGTTTLTKVADSYFFNYGSGGPQLKMNGAYVAVGQFGAWTPLGVEQGGAGYWLAWKNGGADQYVVWNIDGAGNLLSQNATVAGASSGLQQYEPFLHQDLNGDGVIPIEAFGATKLVQVANNYALDPMAALGGPLLKDGGATVTAGQYGAWTPIAAEQTAGGFGVAWKNGAADQYIVWSTDGSGNRLSQTGAMSGSDAALQGYENSFQQDLNKDGVIGIPASAEPDMTLFTNYMASAFAKPASDGTGIVNEEAAFQPILVKPLG